jgi:hypothetical protein
MRLACLTFVVFCCAMHKDSCAEMVLTGHGETWSVRATPAKFASTRFSRDFSEDHSKDFASHSPAKFGSLGQHSSSIIHSIGTTGGRSARLEGIGLAFLSGEHGHKSFPSPNGPSGGNHSSGSRNHFAKWSRFLDDDHELPDLVCAPDHLWSKFKPNLHHKWRDHTPIVCFPSLPGHSGNWWGHFKPPKFPGHGHHPWPGRPPWHWPPGHGHHPDPQCVPLPGSLTMALSFFGIVAIGRRLRRFRLGEKVTAAI